MMYNTRNELPTVYQPIEGDRLSEKIGEYSSGEEIELLMHLT